MLDPIARAERMFNDEEQALREIQVLVDQPECARHREMVAGWVGKVKSVRDLGCGIGLFVPLLDTEEYCGYDSSLPLLQEAMRRYPNTQFQHVNILNPPAIDDKYDMTLLISVAQHYVNPVDVVRRVADVWNVQRYIFSMLVGETHEDLLVTTVVSLSEWLDLMDALRASTSRMIFERIGKEKFCWAYMEVNCAY